jgi:fused signal recognition particle receptor
VTGSDLPGAARQAKVWNREVGVTGLVITKLDGTARGGVVISIVRDVGLPVKLIGVGEGITDLRDFDPANFVDALLGYEVRRPRGYCIHPVHMLLT